MRRTLYAFSFLLLMTAGCTAPKETAVVTERPEPDTTVAAAEPTADAAPSLTPLPQGYDTVQTRRFDQGKMWTFENPPTEYFQQRYDFNPNEAWFRKARLGALRFADYCSASFVSPNGLVLTNHHCARESVTGVTRADENLLEDGFYATSLEEERRVPDLFVEQLVDMEDVTEEVKESAEHLANDEDRAAAIQRKITRMENRLTKEAQVRDENLRVQIVELYDGGRYSAYTFRRYEDVRLVMAPQLQVAFFGGEADNFTYPRYALDMSFFRVYNDEGEPLNNDHYFEWSEHGAREGDAVFAVGNPGSTSRLNTVSQLRYERDVALPQRLEVMRSRAAFINQYIDEHPDAAEEYDLENTYFSLQNSIKATSGQLEGLRDPYLMARRVAAERKLEQAIQETDSLREAYGGTFDEMRAVQRSKEAVATQSRAFAGFGSPNLSSHILMRALYGYIYAISRRRGAPQERLDELRQEALKIDDWPAPLEVRFITARLRALQEYLGENDQTLRTLLQGQSPEERAEQLVDGTVLADSAQFADIFGEGYMSSDDATVPFIKAFAPLYFTVGREASGFSAREQRLEEDIAQARFALYGEGVPPDASFSLRIADGVVDGYEYNGTRAPSHTTFHGMYNHHYTYGPDTDWGLPEGWITPPAVFSRAKALNLVSTNDITGGNSGSPLLNRNLEIVGLVFDSNIEALPNEYLYTNASARAISVDSRGIMEALDDLYDANRIAVELSTGDLVASEDEVEETDVVE